MLLMLPAYTHSLVNKWTFLARTVADIEQLKHKTANREDGACLDIVAERASGDATDNLHFLMSRSSTLFVPSQCLSLIHI